MIRLVAIVTAGTCHVIEAAFGTDKIGELTYAERVATALRPGMLLLADRNFATYRFFTTITGARAGECCAAGIPVGSSRKSGPC